VDPLAHSRQRWNPPDFSAGPRMFRYRLKPPEILARSRRRSTLMRSLMFAALSATIPIIALSRKSTLYPASPPVRRRADR
jgi:hypothetical protein